MFQGKVILVVDDEVDLREILCNELVYEGATVVEAANGIEALEKLSTQKFDAVLSDIRMPGGDGATLAEKIRGQHPFEPVVILITGFADLHSEEAFALGADGYVMKPFHLEDLKHTLDRLMRPPEQRWTQAFGIKSHLIVLHETLADALAQGRFQLGRGGFFLQADPDQARTGDFIEVQLKELDPIQAQVRWVRAENDEHKKPGLGLEFMKIPASAFRALNTQVPDWRSLKSFIPLG